MGKTGGAHAWGWAGGGESVCPYVRGVGGVARALAALSAKKTIFPLSLQHLP